MNGGSRIKRVWRSGAIWSAVAVIMNSIMNFLIIPVVSERLGIEAYGYVTLANTLITYIDVISLAINSFASRYIAIEYHQGRKRDAKIFYSSVFIANLILSGVILSVIFIFIPNISWFINVSQAIIVDVQLLFAIVSLRYILVLMRMVFEVPAFIRNKIYLTEQIRVLSYLLQSAILVFTCIVIPAKIWYVGLASAFAAAFMLVAEIKIARDNTPDLGISFSMFSLDKLKRVLSNGVWNSVNNLGILLNSGLDLLITNRMLTETAMGMISVSKTFGPMCYMLANQVSNAFKPKQLEYYSHNDIKGLIANYKRSMRITGTICTVILAGFICCGREFLSLWLPGQDLETIYLLSVIVLFGDIVTGVVNPLFYTYTLTNNNKVPCLITIVLGLINVVSMYFLIRFTGLGMYAVVMTTTVLNLVHFIDTPLYSAYCLRIKYGTFYPTILLHLFNVATTCGLMWLLNCIYPAVNNWIMMAVKIMVFGMSGTAISLIIMTTKSEKRAIIDKLLKNHRQFER